MRQVSGLGVEVTGVDDNVRAVARFVDKVDGFESLVGAVGKELVVLPENCRNLIFRIGQVSLPYLLYSA